MNGNTPLLLTDEQMRQFITEGFLLLNADFPEEFHQNLIEQLNCVYEKEGNPGNNLLPRIPDLQKVFDHPAVTGALTSVLGPNYMMHSHRHGHYNASPVAGQWHKDSYWGYKRIRNHHPWWAMIMYFPQDTPIELGPTGILPGTQNYEMRTFDQEDPQEEVKAAGPAGTFALIHYDIWHRATPNVLGQHRYMLKFEFMRTEAPVAPSWNNQELDWVALASMRIPFTQQAMWEETWHWLSGKLGYLAGSAEEDAAAIGKLVAELEEPFEPVALNAAYELARRGQSGMESLLEGLHHDKVKVSRLAAYGLSVSGQAAVKGLISALHSGRKETVIHAAFALGELRHLATEAVPALAGLLDHSSELVRRTVVEALSMIGAPAEEVVSSLIRGLQDEDVQVRFMSALSFSRLGPLANAAVSHLQKALQDDNRYVRGHAAEALHYIGTDQAKDVLIDFLLLSRWCPTTTPASTFYP